jgi:hypothetical protein
MPKVQALTRGGDEFDADRLARLNAQASRQSPD